MDRTKVEGFVSGLLAKHCGAKAATNANTVRYFTDAILSGAATPDSVIAQIVQLAQTQQLAQHLMKTSPPTSPLLPQDKATQPGGTSAAWQQQHVHHHQPIPTSGPHSMTPPDQHRPWTTDERARFLEAYELFGDGDWENICAHISTRSLDEVRRYGTEHREYLESKRNQADEEQKMQIQRQEKELEDRMRQLELELQRERAALMNSQPMKVSEAFEKAVQREMDKQLEEEEDELVQRLARQALEEEKKSEEEELKDLADKQRMEEMQAKALRQQELEMERKIALLQQQLAAEKAKMGVQGPGNPFIQFPSVQHLPKPEPVPSPHPVAVPLPTPQQYPPSMPATAVHSAPPSSAMQMPPRPAQFTFRSSPTSAPVPPAALSDYELLFHNVTIPPTLSPPSVSSSSSPLGGTPKPSVQASLPATPILPPTHVSARPTPPHAAPPSTPLTGPSQPTRAPAPTKPPQPPPGLSADAIPDITPPSSSVSSPAASSSKQESRYEFEQVKQYVTELYRVYTGGKLPDPATFRWHIDSIMNGSYSLSQAEYSIRFSKEAKEYAKQQQQKKETQVRQMQEYVRELMRVYCKRAPTEEEMKQYVNSLVSGQANLQQVEDEIRLLGLSAPGDRPSKRP